MFMLIKLKEYKKNEKRIRFIVGSGKFRRN